MSDPTSPTFQRWSEAQQAAGEAERQLALRAAEHAAGRGRPPLAAEIHTTVLLRTKASALLMAVLSESSDASSKAAEAKLAAVRTMLRGDSGSGTAA